MTLSPPFSSHRDQLVSGMVVEKLAGRHNWSRWYTDIEEASVLGGWHDLVYGRWKRLENTASTDPLEFARVQNEQAKWDVENLRVFMILRSTCCEDVKAHILNMRDTRGAYVRLTELYGQ